MVFCHQRNSKLLHLPFFMDPKANDPDKRLAKDRLNHLFRRFSIGQTHIPVTATRVIA